MNGQRVVKVFNHVRKSEEEFNKLNESLFEDAAKCQQICKYYGSVGKNNIGNLQFVLTAVLGGVLAREVLEGDHIRCHGIIPSVLQRVYHTAIYAGRTAVLTLL